MLANTGQGELFFHKRLGDDDKFEPALTNSQNMICVLAKIIGGGIQLTQNCHSLPLWFQARMSEEFSKRLFFCSHFFLLHFFRVIDIPIYRLMHRILNWQHSVDLFEASINTGHIDLVPHLKTSFPNKHKLDESY